MPTALSASSPAHRRGYCDAAHKDAPTSYDGDTYTYDAAGNQITHSNGVTTQQRSFDPENRMFRIVDGDSVSEFVYDANGSRVLKSVSNNGTRERTAYIGSLYEEEITGSANPPYINYYSLGGKMVGMRRANQPSMNGQYRMVTDHLGSASLLVDINGGPSGVPAVVQRQYFRAFGQTAYTWSSGGSLSDIGYTGQRTEGSTGLMFYNARFYDPELSYFASADTLGVDKRSSQTRNRYAYVLNNPLKFIDPTGHSPAGQGDDTEDKSREAYAKSLARYGIDVHDLSMWTPAELAALLRGIHLMMRKFLWSRPEHFREAMGIDTLGRITLVRIGYDDPASRAGGLHMPSGNDDGGIKSSRGIDVAKRVIVMFGSTSDLAGDSDMRVGKVLVHELAHAWDDASRDSPYGRWSKRMMDKTGGNCGGGTYVDGFCRGGTYNLNGTAADSSSHDSPGEDWAEAVENYVYFDGAGMDQARNLQMSYAGWVSVERR